MGYFHALLGKAAKRGCIGLIVWEVFNAVIGISVGIYYGEQLTEIISDVTSKIAER